MRKLLVATNNPGKIKEIKENFKNLKLNIIGLSDLEEDLEVEEDGQTFAENALKKARIRAEKTDLLTLADDSGLEVEYLDGKPGIYSARYAGEDAGDEENNEKLLAELEGLPLEERFARFVCCAALVDLETGAEHTVEGICQGVILNSPRGKGGFGYDPLFFIPQKNKTFAELSLAEKNEISHRARALRGIKEILRDKYSAEIM